MDPVSDPLAVVDDTGRVHSLTGLRVIVASDFPTGPRANLQFAVSVVTERLAGIMRQYR